MIKMMSQTHCLSEHYTKLYLCALSSLAEEYAEWKALSRPSTHIKPPSNISTPQLCEVNKTHKPKEEVILGSVNRGGSITEEVTLILLYQGHKECAVFC